MDIMIAFLLVVFAVFFIARSFSRSFRFIKVVVLNCMLGLVLLISVNFIGTYYGFALGINVITVIIAGFCGIPGVIFLMVFKLFL